MRDGTRSGRSIAGNLWQDYILSLPEAGMDESIDPGKWFVHVIRSHEPDCPACRGGQCNCESRVSRHLQKRYVQAS